jgi:hypothetical protein
MTEVRRGGPEVRPRVTGQDVVESYRAYQGLLQGHAISTVQERLAGYGNMLFNLNAYLAHAPADSQETRSAIQQLFYNHQNYSPVPLDFFIETQKSMRSQVLEGGLYTPGTRIDQELEFARRAVRGELERVTVQYHHEHQSREKLQKLSESAGTEREVPQIALGNTVMDDVQRKAVELLSQDRRPETLDLRDDLIKRRRLSEAVSRLVESGDLDPQSIQQTLSPYEADLLKGQGAYSRLDDLIDRAEAGQTARVTQELTRISEGATEPIGIFREWANKGWIPRELLDSYEEIITIAQLGQVSQEVQELPKPERARALMPFIEKDISAGLILDIVEDRFELSDDLLQAQVDAFLHFYDDFPKEEAVAPLQKTASEFKWGTKQTVIAAALSTVVVAAPFIYLRMTEPPTTAQKIEMMLDEIPPDEVGGEEQAEREAQNPNRAIYGPEDPGRRYPVVIDEGIGNIDGLRSAGVDRGGADTVTVEVRPPNQSGQRPGDSPVPQSGQSEPGVEAGASGKPSPDSGEPRMNPDQQRGSANRHRPENNSIESVEQARKTVMWELEGESLPGYYRENTSSYFDPKTREWHVYRQSRPDVPLITSDRKDIQLRSTFRVGSQIVELPSREGYAINVSGIKIDGEVIRPALVQTSDGNYLLYFPKEAMGKQITLTYALGKTENTPMLAPESRQLSEMTWSLSGTSALPQKDREFIFKIMDRKDLTKLQKAKLLEKYMQETFIYSLSPEDSDWYNQAVDADDYMRRIFERRTVDCDVANTVLVNLLRQQGIPSRLVIGFAHSGGVLSGEAQQLVASEKHGWVEAYIGGKWVTLDGTPTKLDEQTREALGRLLPSRSQVEQADSGSGDPNDMRVRRSPSGRPLPGQENSDEKPQGQGRRDSGGQGRGEGGGQGGGQGAEGGRKGENPQSKRPEPKPGKEAEDFAKAVEEFRKWVAENQIITGILTSVLLNAVFYSLAHAQARNNNKLVEHYTRELGRRFKRYAGPHADILERRFLRDELQKIRRNAGGREFSRKKLLIPPAGLNNLLIDTLKAVRLHMLPYASVDTDSVRRSDNPSPVEFFVGVLGYSEKKIRRELCEEAHREQRKQINERMHMEVESLFSEDAFGGGGAKDNMYAYSMRSRIISRVVAIKEPKTLEEWKEVKAKETASLYARYLKSHEHITEYKIADALAEGRLDVEQREAPLTEDQFRAKMEVLFKYKELIWLCDRAKKQAMAELREGIFPLPGLGR